MSENAEVYSQDILDMLVVVADLQQNAPPSMKALAGTIKQWAMTLHDRESRIRLLEEVCFHEAEMLDAAIDARTLTADFVSVTVRRLRDAAGLSAPAPKEEGEG